MSEQTSGELLPGHVPEADVQRVLAQGRKTGNLTPDDLITVLKDVELNPYLIDGLVERVKAEGIAYVDTDAIDMTADVLDDPAVVDSLTPPAGIPAVAPPANGTRPARGPRAPRPVDPVPYDDGRGAATDPVRSYLKEIGKVQLLTGDEEVVLAKRIEAGLAAAGQIAQHEDAVHGEVDEKVLEPLEDQVADGLLAKRQLTNANLRLVVSIAKRYRKGAMHFLDLIQEGNIGLMRAVDKFDWTKGFKFSTYATWWIRQSITRAIADQGRTIRIPVHMVETINKVLRVQRQLLQELGREPTIDELSAKLGDMTPEKVRDILKINQDTVSLEQPVGDEDDFSLSDTIQDHSAEVPADYAARMLLSEAVQEALGQLAPREREVLRMRFGLDGGEMRTLEEVGREFGVTRERVRQIESKTLAKLRHPIRAQGLRGFLDEE